MDSFEFNKIAGAVLGTLLVVRPGGEIILCNHISRKDDPLAILDTWLAAHADGIACVIGDPNFRTTPRVRSLTPELSKGLEFDLVVLIDPATFGTGRASSAPRLRLPK